MKRFCSFTAAAMALLACAGPGCDADSETARQSPPAQLSEPETNQTDRQVYQVKGVVTEVLGERGKVRIAHEEIPGYMAAMTMLFDVQDTNELTGLEAGDEVAFDMVVTPDDGWIENVETVGKVSEIVTDVPASFRLVRDVDPVEVGDPMPDYTFTNELGQVVRFSDLKGKAYAFTFIFTRCPFPDFCPRMSKNMKAVHEAMTSKPGGPDNWHLFSITIDPQFDTPSVLKGYAQGYNYDPERWNFLTAPLIDITAVAEQVGLQFYRPDPSDPQGLNHNLRTVVVGADGIIRKIIVGNEWKAEEVVSALVEGAQATPVPEAEEGA